MDRNEAVSVLTDAILGDLATITTAPTAEQAEALESVRPEDIAPSQVCLEMDLEQGSTWGRVVAEIRSDVASS